MTHGYPPHDDDASADRGESLLDGKVALITGGTSGIGRAVALAFAREGADLALVHHHDGPEVEETRAMLDGKGVTGLFLKADIAREDECDRVIAETVRRFGRIDILVNNAAVQSAFPDLADMATEDWELMFRTNIFGPFWLSRAAVVHMPAGGSIINTTSLQARAPLGELAAYAATKGALSTFTLALARLLAPRGIRVNAVAPGPVTTPLVEEAMPEAKSGEFGRDTPLGRPAEPSELAAIYVLLASDHASYMTGGIHPVTGGLPMS